MSNKAILAFVETMMVRWPPFRWDEAQERAYADDLMRELSGFTPEVLERARREMIRKRTKPQIPSVAECIGFCAEAKHWHDAETGKGQLIPDPAKDRWVELSDARQRLADDLMPTQIGKQAAKEGWALAFWNFARVNGRAPQSAQDIALCKKNSREFEEAFATAVRGETILHKKCVELGESMRKRGAEKAALALGGRS
jgi:hypothetical protein